MDPGKSSPTHVLDPGERLSEVLSGLIMVLTFTGSFSIAMVGRAEIRSLLIGAVGCNLAWGIIDGVFYLMDCLAARGRGLHAVRSVRSAASPGEGQRAIASALPEIVAAALQPAELEAMRERLVRLPEPPAIPRLNRNDWLGALWVCLIAVLATFPVVVPFLLMHDGTSALRTSHEIAILMMFCAGFAYGRHLGHREWAVGLAMVLLGSTLAGLTIALGG